MNGTPRGIYVDPEQIPRTLAEPAAQPGQSPARWYCWACGQPRPGWDAKTPCGCGEATVTSAPKTAPGG